MINTFHCTSRGYYVSSLLGIKFSSVDFPLHVFTDFFLLLNSFLMNAIPLSPFDGILFVSHLSGFVLFKISRKISHRSGGWECTNSFILKDHDIVWQTFKFFCWSTISPEQKPTDLLPYIFFIYHVPYVSNGQLQWTNFYLLVCPKSFRSPREKGVFHILYHHCGACLPLNTEQGWQWCNTGIMTYKLALFRQCRDYCLK